MPEFKKSVGDALRKARLAMAMSQDDIATEMKVTRQAVGAWEVGRTTPSLREFRDLLLLLGLSADDVLSVVSAAEVYKNAMELRPPPLPQFADSQL